MLSLIILESRVILFGDKMYKWIINKQDDQKHH